MDAGGRHPRLTSDAPDAPGLRFQPADLRWMSGIPDKPLSRDGGCQTCVQHGHPWADARASTGNNYQLNLMPSGANSLVFLFSP